LKGAKSGDHDRFKQTLLSSKNVFKGFRDGMKWFGDLPNTTLLVELERFSPVDPEGLADEIVEIIERELPDIEISRLCVVYVSSGYLQDFDNDTVFTM
jgi:hypothetical protein